jgi:hypothetical protein
MHVLDEEFCKQPVWQSRGSEGSSEGAGGGGRNKRAPCRKPTPLVVKRRIEQIETDQRESKHMPDVTIVFWRDIPAQVIVGKGRSGSKVQLPERFEQAIDRCAMKIGAKDADAYLAEWRKAPSYPVEGEPAEIAASEAARLDAEYDSERLKALIQAEGRAAV